MRLEKIFYEIKNQENILHQKEKRLEQAFLN